MTADRGRPGPGGHTAADRRTGGLPRRRLRAEHLLDHAGQPTGYVDLGSLGVADRWADLAVATCSTEWNYGPDWTDTLLTAYGVGADTERMRYYRLLWDLGP